MCELSQHYDVKKFSPAWDEYMRGYFFGGRVECLKGRGLFDSTLVIWHGEFGRMRVLVARKEGRGDLGILFVAHGVFLKL
jgi:hypothetical protein